MADVLVTADGFVVDAKLIGDAFRMTSETVQNEMRDDRITSRCETGEGDDEGRWRLTFYRDGRALRLIVNASGDVMSRSTFPASAQRNRKLSNRSSNEKT